MKSVIVYLKDGEVLKGKTEQVPNPQHNGFWVHSHGGRREIDRIFISLAGIKKVEVLKDD